MLTQSLCNVCAREVPARVFEQKGRIWMRKACPAHGAFVSVAEKDPTFYKWFISLPQPKHRSFESLLLPLSHREAIKKFKGKTIVISGDEPTKRKDLTGLIRFIKRSGKRAVLETSGIKLAQAPYLKELKNAGLDEVLFSLDSLSNMKKKALLNLKKEHVPTTLCATIQPGLNSHNVMGLLTFALQHKDFVTQMRFRSRGLMLSELFTLFSRQAHIPEKTLKMRFLKGRLGRSVIFLLKGLEVKLVGWPSVENIDLGDLKTPMAYFNRKDKKFYKIFHGALLEEKER